MIDTVAPVLRKVDDPLRIDGHTNQVPVKPKYYPTDWELSAARAITVLRHLNDVGGIPNERMTASAFGHEKPLIDPAKPGSQRSQQASRHRRPVRPARRRPGRCWTTWSPERTTERHGGIPVSTTMTAPPTEETAEATKGGGKLKKILILVVLLAVVGGAVWFFFLKPKPVAPPEPGEVVTLEPIQINLAAGHYLRVGIALQLHRGGARGRRQQGPRRDDRDLQRPRDGGGPGRPRSASTSRRSCRRSSSTSTTAT